MKHGARVVLYVEHMAEVGGGQVSLIELLRSLDRERYMPLVTCVSRGEFCDRVSELGVDMEIVDIRGVLRKNPIRTIGNMRALYRLMRDRGVDIVHLNSLKALLTVCIPARLMGVPLVWHCRVTSDYGKLFDLVGCISSSAIVVPSRFLSARFRWLRLCSKKARFIPNAVDVRSFGGGVAENARAEFNLPERAFVIGCAGRLEEEKGFHLLIEAARGLAPRLPDLRLLVVGGAPDGVTYGERLRRAADGPELASSVIFTGYRRDVRDCLAAMDVVVVPSLREVFGRVAVEAMALGRPVVATSVGGLPEVVEDGVTGVLVPPGDVSALAEAIARLHDDRDLARKMGAAGRRRAEEVFDLRVHVTRIQELYDRVLGDVGDRPLAKGGGDYE